MTNWTKPLWTIRRATGPGKKVIFKNKAANEFRLVATNVGRKVKYYSVTHVKDAMTRYWAKCTFFPRGAAPERWRFAKLPKNQAQWKTSDFENLKKFAARTTVNSRRLEGDFDVKGKAEAVTLWIAEKAIVGNQPLLLIDLKGPSSLRLDQSGSGTGDPK